LASTKQFYEIDETDGIIINKRSAGRAFVFGLKPWTSLIERLYERFGSGAEVILFDIGKSYGLSIAEDEKKIDPKQEYSEDFLAGNAAIAGWGRIKVSRGSLEELSVRVEKCVFCAGIDDSREKQVPCFFLRGIVAGFVEYFFNVVPRVDELHCGLDYCEFRVLLSK
jgi:predicted hydrocarbon binding protein